MKETAKTSTPEVDLNPHSDLPVAGIISTEISGNTFGERPGVSLPMSAPADAERPLPFGVYRGKQPSRSAVVGPQS